MDSSALLDLENPIKTCIYIPPDETEEEPVHPTSAISVEWRDVSNGPQLRIAAYKAAWNKCLQRVQSIIQALNETVVKDVVGQVVNAYHHTLPGLPYPELPVIAVSGGSAALYSDIFYELDNTVQKENMQDFSALQIHLYPQDSLSLTTMMKAIVVGFSEHDKALTPAVKRKPTTSLANYDTNLLHAWYDTLDNKPNLIIYLHDFEQFNPTVVQDVFYICSLHIPRLPLVFILALSSPPLPSYIHVNYPRATLALIRLHTVVAPAGRRAIEKVINKTFFDPEFEPDIMLGPATLDFLHNFAQRQSTSLDAFLTVLQLTHMKHFTEPLTVLVHDESILEASTSASDPFVQFLRARLVSDSKQDDIDYKSWNALDVTALVADARSTFRRRSRAFRIGLHIVSIMRRVCVTHEETHGDTEIVADVATLSDVLKGRLRGDVKFLGMAVKKSSLGVLRELLEELHYFFNNLPSLSRREEEIARVHVVAIMAQMPADPEISLAGKDLAQGFGEWLINDLEVRFAKLTECVLWDVWYTGSTPFPSEIINPAPRASIVSALLHPQIYRNEHTRVTSRGNHAHLATNGDASLGGQHDDIIATDDMSDEDGNSSALWELPDTSILFRRYAEAGRMVNVYDLFQSFASVLDAQHRQRQIRDAPHSPSKAKRRAGTKHVNDHMDEDTETGTEAGSEMEEEEDDDDSWRIEVQARFMHALHELDYMGFVKHTRRKADHIVRTVYDIPD